jgi:predicted nucleotide-binding protein
VERKYPVLFVGSATEDLGLAEAVQQRLEHHAEVETWHEGGFLPSGSALPSLLVTASRVDFALLIGTSVDTLSTRGETFTVMRDNVLFELGIFFGALGAERTFFLTDRAKPIQLPSDLIGVTPLTFDSRKENMQSAVGSACTEIVSAMKALGLRGGGNG